MHHKSYIHLKNKVLLPKKSTLRFGELPVFSAILDNRLYISFFSLHNKNMKFSGFNGFLVLTISGLICKAIGVFFRLPLTYILGVNGLGIFQLVMGVFSFALVFASGGMTISLSKLISSARAKNENEKIGKYVFVALVYSVLISLFLGAVFWIISKPLAFSQGIENANNLYKLFFPLLCFSSLICLFRGIYQGYENMLPTAISQIIEQIGKFCFGILFAYIFAKNSVEQGVLGAFVGIIFSEFLAFIYLLFADKKIKIAKAKESETKEFFKYFIFSSGTVAVSSFTHFFDSIIVINRLTLFGMTSEFATTIFGLQTGIVGAFLNLPIIIAMSLSTAILPKLSYDNSTSQENSSKGFNILWFCLLPTTLGLLGISFPLFQILYPFLSQELYEYAVKLMAIGSLSTVFLGISQYFSTLLQAKGNFKFVFICQIFGGMAKIFCTIFLCPKIGIYGIAIGNLFFSFITSLMLYIKIRSQISISTNQFFLPLIGSLSMLIVITSLVFFLQINLFVKVTLCIVLGVFIYIIATIKLFASFKNQLFVKKSVGESNEKN